MFYAPSVRMIQPAFIYGEEAAAKIYFSFPIDWNKDVTKTYKIAYSLTDPNLQSSWGTNNKLKEAQYEVKYGLFYHTVDLPDNNYFEIDLKNEAYELTKNQYYSVQIWLVNGENVVESNISQVTLIRPIEEPIFNLYVNSLSEWETPGGSASASEFIEQPLKIRGWLTYENNSSNVETIDYYYYQIIKNDGDGDVIIFESEYQDGTGLSFERDIDFLFEEGEEYKIQCHLVTKHEYELTETTTFILKALSQTDATGRLGISKAELLKDGRAVQIYYWAGKGDDISGNYSLKLQRSDKENIWQTIIDDIPFGGSGVDGDEIKVLDFSGEWSENTKYRLLYRGSYSLYQNDLEYFVSDEKELSNSKFGTFNGVTLIGDQMGIFLDYDIEISNFKYVKQESISNPLGGRYPIIRKNGDTNYCQFSLSGTLYIGVDQLKKFLIEDSRGKEVNFEHNDSTQEIFLIAKDKNIINFKSNDDYYNEKELRLLLMSFLNDSKPKLFRSYEEGNMIVYLSNVSFTPNKTLGRHVYSFSATVTELCEYNKTNLLRYNLNSSGFLPILKE